MVTTASEHSHCFCTSNAAGTPMCCHLSCQALLSSAGDGLKARAIRFTNWVDANLFFVNAHNRK